MNYNVLGADEQSEGLPFVRLFNPTEFEKAVNAINRRVLDNYSWDWINPDAWSAVGAGGENVTKFLRAYIDLASEWREPITADNQDKFGAAMVTRFGFEHHNARELTDALYRAVVAGKIAPSILKPWTYVPSKDDGFIDLKPFAPLTNKLLVAAAVVGLGYAAFAQAPTIASAMRGNKATRT